MPPGESARRLGLKRGRKVVRVDIRLGKRLAGMWPLLRLKVLQSQPRLKRGRRPGKPLGNALPLCTGSSPQRGPKQASSSPDSARLAALPVVACRTPIKYLPLTGQLAFNYTGCV